MLGESTAVEATSVFYQLFPVAPQQKKQQLNVCVIVERSNLAEKQAAPAPPGPFSLTLHSFIYFISPLTF